MLLRLMILATLIATAQADDHQRNRDRERREHRNYILERQESYQVQGVPTSRIIVGKREVDIYPNGLMFEGNHVVGVKRDR